MQFRAQYYNDPSDPDNQPISSDKFQYYDRAFLKQQDGYWKFKGKRLNLVAAIDFAYSLRAKADFTCIVVIGTDSDGMIYVIDIDRFKTDSISDYYKAILRMHTKWGFRKLRAEATAAQAAIIKSLKQDYLVPNGISLVIEDVKPNRHQGSKVERIEALLMPKYENLGIFHYRGGNTQILEEELQSRNPPHDDVKDALATAIEGSVRPTQRLSNLTTQENIIPFSARFGGRG